MFEGFNLKLVETERGRIRVRVEGSGPPILLIHGHPRTHMTWGAVADLLASSFTVVCPDLPGFGHSYIPPDAPDSRNSSKREKAAALVDLMRRLDFQTYVVLGHDRGSLTAFRMAMDYPEVVEKLIVVDCLPVLEHLERADWKFARDWYHWFFFAQPEKPERVISADPSAWYDKLSPDRMGIAAYDDMLEVIHNTDVIHGMIEDYRAGVRIDHIHDRADRDAGRKIPSPVLCLWSLRDDLEQIYGDPVAIWKTWADNVHGYDIDSGHHVAEENPGALSKAVKEFLVDKTNPAVTVRNFRQDGELA
jgi:haloacetate dehalogenase